MSDKNLGTAKVLTRLLARLLRPAVSHLIAEHQREQSARLSITLKKSASEIGGRTVYVPRDRSSAPTSSQARSRV